MHACATIYRRNKLCHYDLTSITMLLLQEDVMFRYFVHDSSVIIGRGTICGQWYAITYAMD